MARAKALSKLYGGNATTVYTDAANHNNKRAMVAVVTCESEHIVSVTAPRTTTREAEESWL